LSTSLPALSIRHDSHESHNHHNTTSAETFDGAVAEAIDTLKDEMPGGELALIVCLVAGACFVLGGFVTWLFLRGRKGWRKCGRCERRRRARKAFIDGEGRLWYGREKSGQGKVGKSRRQRRSGSGVESAAEEYVSGIY